MFTGYKRHIIGACLRFLFVFYVISALAFSPGGSMPSRASDITLLVDTTFDSNDPAYQICSAAPGDCSLRGAISLANSDHTNKYVINIPTGTYTLSAPGANEDENNTGDLDIKGNLSLIGLDTSPIIQGSQLDRVFHVQRAANVIITNFTITGGRSPDGVDGGDGESGGGIYNQGSLTIQNCVIEDNFAGSGASAGIGLYSGGGGSGGGIYNKGLLTINNSVVRNNTSGTGGAGYVCSWDPYQDFCWDCNSGGAGGWGGGIYNTGTLNLDSSTLNNNTAGAAGSPGVCLSWGAFIYTPGISGSGGGIANLSNLSLAQSNIYGNNGILSGGGLLNQGLASLFNVSISNNNASEGGGVSNRRYLNFSESLVISNTGDSGGGIFNNYELQILNCTIGENNAASGGGLYNSGEAFLAGGMLQNNWTRNGPDGTDETGCIKFPCPPTDGGSPHGGGIYNLGTMQLDKGIVSGNATGDGGKGGNGEVWSSGNGGNGGFGGGIFNTGNLNMNFTSILSNKTGNGGEGGTGGGGDGQDGVGGFGGGIYNSGMMTVTLSPILDNFTGTGGGRVGVGGGIANQGRLAYSYAVIADNQTSPGGDGGGIYTSSPLTITGTTVISNTAGGRGGGLFTEGGVINSTNNIFARNVAGLEYQGSGLYLRTTTANFLHTTLAQNTGGDSSGIEVVDASLAMTNTILVSHTIGISVAQGAEATFTATLWGDGIWANERDWAGSGSIITGTDNYWLEPGFVDPSGLDYHIGPSSPAIDRGVQTTVHTDLDNQPRPNPDTGIGDLGADEYWEFVPISGVTISGPLTGTTYSVIGFTSTVTPATATPNILFFWMPPPDSGQWTNSANYLWTSPGTRTVEVSAFNASSMVTVTFTISLEADIQWLFLPVVFR